MSLLQSEPAEIARRASTAPTTEVALATLRFMPLDDFGLLLLDPAAYELGHLLPRMAPADVQQHWTGAIGHALLAQSLSFMRSLESVHARIKAQPMQGKRMLDFGCGWGRLLRLALYYSNPSRLHGVDPLQKSIDLCRECRVPGELAVSDYLPTRLAVSAPPDVAYAFSVFTHLNARAAKVALSALRASIATNGLLVFTIRPVEYWQHHKVFHQRTRDDFIAQHEAEGFAYQPHGNIVAQGEAIYGDASMSLDFVRNLLSEAGWHFELTDRSMGDPFQVIIAATPATLTAV